MDLRIKKIYLISLFGAFTFFILAPSVFGQTTAALVGQKIQARQQFLEVRAQAKSVMIQAIGSAIATRKLGDIEIAKAAFVQAVLGRVNDILYPIFGSADSSPGPLPVVASSAFVEKVTSPLSVACSASPSEINVNQSVAWNAVYSGGNASYSFSWSGSDGLSGTESAVTKTYSSAGRKTASVIVSSGGQTVTKDCGAISVTDPVSMIQKILTFVGLGKTVAPASPDACGDGSIGGWSTCSATCGGGTQTKIIVNSDCSTRTESQSCNTQACPPPCGSGSVGGWSSCSTACGGGTETRIVTNPDCSAVTETQSCNTDVCPQVPPACGVGSIGQWSACSVTCGGGIQHRTVTNPDCSIYADSQVCNTQVCPPPCGSGSVGSWSACSAACGGGTQTRATTAANCATGTESPACGGGTQTRATTAANCATGTESQSCNTQACVTTPVIDYFGSDQNPLTMPYLDYNSVRTTAVNLNWKSSNTNSCTIRSAPTTGWAQTIYSNGPAAGSYAVTWLDMEHADPNSIFQLNSQGEVMFNLVCSNAQGIISPTSQIAITVLNPYHSGGISCPNGVIVDGVCRSSAPCSILGYARSATFCQRAYTCTGGIVLLDQVFYCTSPAFRISD
ncbi:MAG: hypothetical protein NTW60_03520 [Candidatus Wolfebacteria bacterium]|nr:hypothetical protein [Candidatus Wolfebacteria bacterium]